MDLTKNEVSVILTALMFISTPDIMIDEDNNSVGTYIKLAKKIVEENKIEKGSLDNIVNLDYTGFDQEAIEIINYFKNERVG